MLLIRILTGALLVLSYTNVLPEIVWPQAILGGFGFYFALIHLCCLLCLPFLRSRLTARFFRMSMALSAALLLYYGLFLGIRLAPRGGEPGLQEGFELRFLLAVDAGPERLSAMLAETKPQLVALAGPAARCPGLYPFSAAAAPEEGLVLCSQFQTALQKAASVERELPPSFIASVDLPEGGKLKVGLVAAAVPVTKSAFAANDVAVRRLAANLRHTPSAIAAGDFAATIFGKPYSRFTEGALMTDGARDARDPYTVLSAAVTPLHIFYKGDLDLEEFRAVSGAGRFLLARFRVRREWRKPFSEILRLPSRPSRPSR